MEELFRHIEIGGVEQYILVRGNKDKPILLFIHGGPGTTNSGYIYKYQQSLENEFLVVNWDQRGAGKSFNNMLDFDDVSLEIIVDDAIELIKILMKEYSKDSIYLVGHSFGALVGVKVAEKEPNLVKAYLSISQVVNIEKEDKICYEQLLKLSKKMLRFRDLDKLKSIGKPPYNRENSVNIFNKYVSKYKMNINSMSYFSFMIKSFSFKYYNLYDWINFLRGIGFSKKAIYKEIEKIDLLKELKSIKVPVYFFVGFNDYITPLNVIGEFYDSLEAPEKKIYIFKNSSHLPHIEEEHKFFTICKSIKDKYEKYN
ncbi:alpha/beta fold hydrolase [Clostridium septicum]|uniref:alpha/beta fold hydrolase n=1 Tax=Clostridium septicum TaxID=1504 RepID=UPI00082C566A|nr:alpha/beta hydrolase [Clostridium septicum]